MPGSYPTGGATPNPMFFPCYMLIGWTGTVPTSAILLSTVQGTSQNYFSPDQPCSVYMATFGVIPLNSTACTLTFQAYGNTTSGNGNLIGPTKAISVPASGSNVCYSLALSISMTVNGYLGMSVLSSVSTATVGINVQMWASQTTP